MSAKKCTVCSIGPGSNFCCIAVALRLTAQGPGVVHTNWSDFDACFQNKQSPLEGFHQHGGFICRQESFCQWTWLPLWIVCSIPTHWRGLSEPVIWFSLNKNTQTFSSWPANVRTQVLLLHNYMNRVEGTSQSSQNAEGSVRVQEKGRLVWYNLHCSSESTWTVASVSANDISSLGLMESGLSVQRHCPCLCVI